MADFISSFSQPFVIALAIWPFLALFLTFPILLIEYIRFHRLPKGRVVVIYFLMLYALGLVAFTLYPLPSDPAAFCNSNSLQPQLNPFQFISDMQHSGLQALMQIGANIIFFVPLGIALRNIFGLKLIPTILISFAVSLTIETAQLTGIFGVYPCAYRLFDVDDLIFNTLGALIGFALARILPNWSRAAKREKVNTEPGAVHRFVAFVGDHLLANFAALILSLPFYFFTDNWQNWQTVMIILCFNIFHFFIPFVNHGQTVFGKLTGISLDNQKRKPFHRLVYYLARLALLGGIIFAEGLPLLLILLVTITWWLMRKKLPYEIVDLIFSISRPGPSKRTKQS
ncbi:MAG: VanZ family protein [Candidatus Saccharimonadales bacterium]